MADYRYIKCKFWSDDYIQNLTPEEKMIYIWLFTNEHSTQAGIYTITLKTVSFETGHSVDKISEIFSKFSKDRKIVYTKNNLLWVKNFLRHQPNRSEKVLKRVARDLKEFNSKAAGLVKQFMEYYQDIPIPYRYPIDRLSTKEKEKEKEKKKKRKSIKYGQDELDRLFEKLWSRYPKKVDKSEAKRKWLTNVVGKGVDPGKLEDALTGYINVLNKNETPVYYAKHAKTFLYPGNKSRNIPPTWEQFLEFADPRYRKKPPL